MTFKLADLVHYAKDPHTTFDWTQIGGNIYTAVRMLAQTRPEKVEEIVPPPGMQLYEKKIYPATVYKDDRTYDLLSYFMLEEITEKDNYLTFVYNHLRDHNLYSPMVLVEKLEITINDNSKMNIIRWQNIIRKSKVIFKDRTGGKIMALIPKSHKMEYLEEINRQQEPIIKFLIFQNKGKMPCTISTWRNSLRRFYVNVAVNKKTTRYYFTEYLSNMGKDNNTDGPLYNQAFTNFCAKKEIYTEDLQKITIDIYTKDKKDLSLSEWETMLENAKITKW